MVSKRLASVLAMLVAAVPVLAGTPAPPTGVRINDPTRGGVWPTGNFTCSGTGPVGATVHISLYIGNVVPGDSPDEVVISDVVTTVNGSGKWSVTLNGGATALTTGTIDYSDVTNFNYWYQAFGGS
jgi:hypothetical protein